MLLAPLRQTERSLARVTLFARREHEGDGQTVRESTCCRPRIVSGQQLLQSDDLASRYRWAVQGWFVGLEFP